MERPPQAPAHLREDPSFYAEGLRWVRMDLTPPVERIFQDGTIYERPYALSAGEGEPAAPGGGPSALGTTVTFAVAASADDQHVYRQSSATYPPTTAIQRSTNLSQVYASRSKIDGAFQVSLGLLRFDTSSLPDAVVITAATLRMHVKYLGNADGRNFRGEYYAWDGASASDYTDDASEGTSAFEVPVSAIIISDNDFVLSNLSLISKTGLTSFRLHITGGEPTGRNNVQSASFDDAVYPEPRLIVTYTN